MHLSFGGQLALLGIVQFVGRNELYSCRVDAVALSRRLRSIVEYMAHVRVALRASHFRANTVWIFKK